MDHYLEVGKEDGEMNFWVHCTSISELDECDYLDLLDMIDQAKHRIEND